MRSSSRFAFAAVLVACALVTSNASALAINQVDTFEDGTTQNWTVAVLGVAHPAPPQNIATGGPAGAGDNFMLLTALGGSGAGSRLSVINLAQWAGDYLAAGIGAIQMDVMNLGPDDLFLRLLLADPGAGPPTNIAISADAVFVPAGLGWTTVVLPIGLASLLAVAGDVLSALANATELRLFHSQTATFPPPPVFAQLGVDNIRAVPEPSALAAIAVALLAMCLRLRRT